MKRGGELRRYAALKQKTELKRGAPLKRTAWNYRPKRTSEDKKWQAAVRLKDGSRCQMCGIYDPHIDTHHVASRKRRPDLKHDVSNGICLCRQHHQQVHASPRWAAEMGYLSTEKYELVRRRKIDGDEG